jgi:hypothetical protein
VIIQIALGIILAGIIISFLPVLLYFGVALLFLAIPIGIIILVGSEIGFEATFVLIMVFVAYVYFSNEKDKKGVKKKIKPLIELFVDLPKDKNKAEEFYKKHIEEEN